MIKTLSFQDSGWADYLYWQTQDKRTLKKINSLLRAIDSNPFAGEGKPEPLKHNMQGYWSRRIDGTNRIVYSVTDDQIIVVACRGHYDD